MYDYLTISKKKGLMPVTIPRLKNSFQSVGIKKGDIVMVHASISSLGYVIGGAEAIYEALYQLIGSEGTIVVPSQTVEISDPSSWQYPAIPSEWFEMIREHLPAFDKERSFSKAMGEFSHFIGRLPNSYRSNHPMYSFSATGFHAKEIVEHQTLDFPFGLHSPLSKMYDFGAKILMIGTDFETNTALHLAEHFLNREVITEKSKMSVSGQEKWVEFKTIDLDIYNDYLNIQEFFKHFSIKSQKLNEADITCFSLVDCVDFTKRYYTDRHE